MKKLISAILLMSILSPAAFAKLETVSRDEMMIYWQVLREQNLDCKDAIDNILYSNRPDFKVDKTGNQPAFLLSTETAEGRHVLALYTSADQQRVTRGNGEYFSSRIVNRGTVVAPNYVQEWFSAKKYNCALRASK